MKLVFALGLLVFYMHICSSEIIGIPGKIVPRNPKPLHGECFHNTEIMCSQAGMKVQYDLEKCVDCTCDGDGMGVTCCNVEPYPIVCSTLYCQVWLNPDTCYYERTKKVDASEVPPRHLKLWRGACRIEHYEIADLSVLGEGVTWKPEDDKHSPKQKSNSKL
ncbi:hypothetical protein HOLleu_16029 [Holothuria leucospilota]|uniref:Uncharacterized protein n=1 Tax=Holothuria leucospilota TaxID=206669 RepID=A0A9Q1C5Q9_HOLLE|nr:hypothetical protein HOLleu_16029 [Holothuria leucospilota]